MSGITIDGAENTLPICAPQVLHFGPLWRSATVRYSVASSPQEQR